MLRFGFCTLAVSLLMACTADPISGPKIVKSVADVERYGKDEGAVERWTAANAKREYEEHPDLPQARANYAAALLREGRHEEAIRILNETKLDSSVPPEVREVHDYNRDVAYYERQRWAFVGMGMVANPRVGASTTFARTAYTRNADGVTMRRLWAQHIGIDLGGLALDFPVYLQSTRREDAAFIGPLGVTLQGWIGKASRWQNTKMTAGLDMRFGTTRYGVNGGGATAFFGIAQRFEWIALSLTLAPGFWTAPGADEGTSGTALRYDLQGNLLFHDRFIPFVSFAATNLFGSGRDKDGEWTVTSGLHYFLGARKDWILGMNASGTRFGYIDHAGTTEGLGASISKRW